MNTPLAGLIKELGLDPVDAMNLLQSKGVISDNCVDIADIAQQDEQRAINRLKQYAKDTTNHTQGR